jgi:hypothetical protein
VRELEFVDAARSRRSMNGVVDAPGARGGDACLAACFRRTGSVLGSEKGVRNGDIALREGVQKGNPGSAGSMVGEANEVCEEKSGWEEDEASGWEELKGEESV